MQNKAKLTTAHLPQALKSSVRKVSGLLGRVIREYEGDSFYQTIESYRQLLKQMRMEHHEAHLASLFNKVKRRPANEQYKIAHAFALLLELINCCESAYRTWRIRHSVNIVKEEVYTDLDFVLTAHPTEARAKEVVSILHRITHLLVSGMHNEMRFDEAELVTLLRFLWNFPLAKKSKPTVMSEAEYIYSLIFSDSVFDFILTPHSNYRLRLSTWVGGDKDGHPGVDDKTMLACLKGSRRHLLNIIDDKLNQVLVDLKQLEVVRDIHEVNVQHINRLRRAMKRLRKLSRGDGANVLRWQRDYHALLAKSTRFISKHYQILKINQLMELFPALVLPIELREDAKLIHDAVTKPSLPICRMLKTLKQVAKGYTITAYAHALIISNCSSSRDIDDANGIIQRESGTKQLPIVPLFEDRESLLAAPKILEAWLQNKSHQVQVKKNWGNRFEIMLGYSDSSKQVGVLSSRFLIREAMFSLEKLLHDKRITPVFFHGAGGSVDRGGGSLAEQIAWWPNAAIKYPTLTIQGEMVQRTFATREILQSQCELLSLEAARRYHGASTYQMNPYLKTFIDTVENAYRTLTTDDKLIRKALMATPFDYLNLMKIGSRPTKRTDSEFDLKQLRAIPWVLCWTQTRLLLPTWWGTGTAWFKLSHREKHELKRLYRSDPFFASYVKALGFTLAKIEMVIWEKYLVERLSKRDAALIYHYVDHELSYARRFVREVTGSTDYLPHRLWLQESISLRSPYVHILNLLQIIAMQNHDEVLLKETLVGIACGMLTTG